MSVSATHFPLHPFIEGERVHYRSLADIQESLNEGYLELETMVNTDMVHYLIRLIDGRVTLTWAKVGDLPSFSEEGATLADLKEALSLDLHAYRWYPHREVAANDHWLLYGQEETRQQVSVLLKEPMFRHFLDAPDQKVTVASWEHT